MKIRYIALVLLIAFAACKSKKEKVVDIQVDVAPQDTVQAPPPAPEPEPEVQLTDEGVNLDDTYFLVVDSYTVEEFAEAWNKKYQERGFKSAVVMKNEDGYFRLALKSFDQLEDAQKALTKLQEDPEFKDVWIMVIK